MDSEDAKDRERELRERIIHRMQSLGQAHRPQVKHHELQNLKAAANRLDRLLRDARQSEQDELRTVAVRLDQLLSDIDAGKDVVKEILRRENLQKE